MWPDPAGGGVIGCGLEDVAGRNFLVFSTEPRLGLGIARMGWDTE
jgi:hypothetical protein